MSNITPAREALITRILEGDGRASRDRRRAAFDNAGLAKPLNTLVDKLTKHAYRVTDEDIAAARASGLSEDQIFEIVSRPTQQKTPFCQSSRWTEARLRRCLSELVGQ